ncbi:hypothetical protein [Candidatus Sororendozoicomonas aggregata]|uniref:hypothetical protein n=1 Tax=Candidatus Sororendozoicomonas aggregata TaxID=3073239 RepID=UPI002ED6671A
MIKNKALKISTISLISAFLVACGSSVEGEYSITDGPVKGVTVVLGDEKFAFSSGATGTYEVTDNKVIFSGMTFSGVMQIEGSDLVNDKWHFSKDT